MCRKARLRPSASQDVLSLCLCIAHRTWSEPLAAAVVETLAKEEDFSILTLAGLDRAVFDSDLYIEFRVQVGLCFEYGSEMRCASAVWFCDASCWPGAPRVYC